VNVVWGIGGFVQGLVGGIVCLAILAIRAAIEGRTGVTFADLWTAVAVGIAVGIVPVAAGRIIEWRVRRELGPISPAGRWTQSTVAWDRLPDQPGGTDRFDKFTDGAR
jgi:hypothetical protein